MYSTVTNAAKITVFEPIDNNYKNDAGDISVGGCVVYATKGKPFEPMRVYGNTTNLVDYYGTPLPKKAEGMEGLRHLNDAIEGCTYVNCIRVVSTKYRFPSLAFLKTNQSTPEAWAEGVDYVEGDLVVLGSVSPTASGPGVPTDGSDPDYVGYGDDGADGDTGDTADTTETEPGAEDAQIWICAYDHTSDADNQPGTDGGSAYWLEFNGVAESYSHRYNEEITAGDGALFAVWPTDGDTSENRCVRIENVDTEEKRFDIVFSDIDDDGEEYDLESFTVGLDVDDKDDMGVTAYIEDVFDNNSDYFKVSLAEGVTWEDAETTLLAMQSTRTIDQPFYFEGGVEGGYPDTSEWLTGVNLFYNENLPCNLLFAAGQTEASILREMASVADFRHIAFFFDIPGSLKATAAIDWIKDLNITSRHARAYYSPWTAYDPWRDGQTLWGVSGAMATAKARCNKIQNVKSTWGVHYCPAGENRGYLSRSSLTEVFSDDSIDRDDFYDARINPIVAMSSGGCCADDDLTQWRKTNYLRFGWINDVLDYIDHQFVYIANQVKFEPDRITRENLTDLFTEVLNDLVTSDALVEPRQPEKDGTSPFILTVVQQEIDYWSVTWEVCITGAARRIAGQPVLIK